MQFHNNISTNDILIENGENLPHAITLVLQIIMLPLVADTKHGFFRVVEGEHFSLPENGFAHPWALANFHLNFF